MMTDNIADMLTRIRNANALSADKVDMPANGMKLSICKVLKEEGFIKSYKMKLSEDTRIILRVYLKSGAINGIVRVSRPGLRRYCKSSEMPRVRSGLGVAILTTSKGVLSSRLAKKLGVGGEIICSVW